MRPVLTETQGICGESNHLEEMEGAINRILERQKRQMTTTFEDNRKELQYRNPLKLYLQMASFRM